MTHHSGWKQRILDAADMALAVLDTSGAIVLLNRRCADLAHASRRSLIGRNWFEWYLPATESEAPRRAFHAAMEGSNTPLPPFGQPITTRNSDGRSIAWRQYLLHDRQGAVEGVLCIGTDVTEQLQHEQELRYESEEQSTLNAILRISLEDIPLLLQFERVLDILLALSWLPLMPKGGIFQTDPESETLLLKAQRGLHPALLKACARVPFGLCLCGRAAASRQIQFATCLDQRHDISYNGMAPHGHYNVPILSRRGVLGVIVLYLKEGHRQNDREMEFLGSVANTLAGLIEHHLTQEALRTSEAWLAEAQHIARLGSWEWLAGKEELHFSEEVFRLLGLPPSAKGPTLEAALAYAHPADRPLVQEAIEGAIAHGTPLAFDFRIRPANGKERTLHMRAEPILGADGQTGRLSGTVQDISERKQMEAELQQAATVFENTTEGVMITDAKSRIIAVNKAFSDITGYGQEELIGCTPAALKSGRHPKEFYTTMWETIETTGRWQGELWNRRKDGDIYPEWLNISVVKDQGGTITHYVGVFSDISAMKESESKLDHLAHHDPLTGLPNRLLLNVRMEHALARARRNDSMIAVLFLDLDRFKIINDTLGHPIGDLLLQEVAERLRACVREEDTVTRQGGDEFIILLEDLHDTRTASIVAQKVIAALAERFLLQEHEVFVTCSIGISLFPDDGTDITTLLKNADSALYRAKEQGRDNYQYYTEELTTRAMERLAMENHLRHALERNELVLHYQPQVDLYSGSIIGMEALLRWQHPEMGLVAPATFIPLAEETGLIVPIGEWVLYTACHQLKQWIDAGMPKIRVAVNLSSRQFNQKNLDVVIANTLRDTGLDPQCLELELTESLIMQDAKSAIIILKRLKQLGVQFSIDDFGTGYSSLSYLKQFPIDRIKIDQSFVRNITSDPEDAAVSQAIISLSHSLNMKTVAEGVETIEQREFLRSRHCDELQGYHFSRPVPAPEMERLLREGTILGSGTLQPAEERVLLLVDDEESMLNALTRALRPEGYRILSTTDPRAALDLLATHPVGVIISDQRMPEITGLELLRKARRLHPDTVRIMLTAHADTRLMAAAINEGAIYKFIEKPWESDHLRAILRDAFKYYAAATRSV